MYFASILALLPLALATPVKRAIPTVSISSPQATIVGSNQLLTENFVGIPFAQPPVGNLRLKPPQPLTAPLGTVKASGLIGPSCPQQFFDNDTPLGILPTDLIGKVLDLPFFQTVTGQTEDCLTIDIVRPAGTTADSKLPVLFWIFGGGFELGSTAMYNGNSLVTDAVNSKQPIIYVAVNYRVAGFGFLAGPDLAREGSTNLGLLDQRLGLQWVADNIAAFGGDPDKVTIWGESAGAISVLDQMILYDGNHNYKNKPLFRGAIMNSGSIVPADPVDGTKGTAIYNAVVTAAGCGSASDKLACLRAAPYDTFLGAVNSVPSILSYQSLNLAYLPRPDGRTLTQSPEMLVQQNKFAKVPFIVGDQEDEGTLFALTTSNITTTEDIVEYFADNYFFGATREQISSLVNAYPDEASAGSPFRTSILYNIYPEFKRLAAMLGDLTFTLSRRAFLATVEDVDPSVKKWSYLATYNYGLPILGTLHGSDILQVFYGILPNYASRSIHSYYFSFVRTLDPNTEASAAGFPNWPQWTNAGDRQLIEFQSTKATPLKDDFRTAQYNAILPLTSVLKV